MWVLVSLSQIYCWAIGGTGSFVSVEAPRQPAVASAGVVGLVEDVALGAVAGIVLEDVLEAVD